MAFVRKKTKVYSWPVEVKTPSETNIGEFDTSKFIGKFKRLSRSELNSFNEESEYKALKEFAEDIDFVAGVLDAFKKFYANAQVGN